MPELTIRDLKLGLQSFDIKFERHDAGTEFEVIRGPKDRVAKRSMSISAIGELQNAPN